eukprot:Lithocolla_globosa_v1_NODE_2863_length_1842_cov_16.945719.p4 type:complete len:102 gc:universal NODE_2863_length_1842_cov_16.945719:1400-1705(+)
MMSTQSSTCSLTYPLLKAVVPIAAPRCRLPSVVNFTPVPSKILRASSISFSLFTMSHVLSALGKYPYPGPNRTRASHHCRIRSKESAPVPSSANHTCLESK